MTKKLIKQWSFDIIGCAIEVHRHLGPGLLESVYEACFHQELISKGFHVECQGNIPVEYKGIKINANLRFDFLVNNAIIVENKSVETLQPIYKAVLLSYMKLSRKPKGMIFNFGCENIRSQMVSLVNDYFQQLPEE